MKEEQHLLDFIAAQRKTILRLLQQQEDMIHKDGYLERKDIPTIDIVEALSTAYHSHEDHVAY